VETSTSNAPQFRHIILCLISTFMHTFFLLILLLLSLLFGLTFVIIIICLIIRYTYLLFVNIKFQDYKLKVWSPILYYGVFKFAILKSII
jgi:hypothetical protein